MYGSIVSTVYELCPPHEQSQKQLKIHSAMCFRLFVLERVSGPGQPPFKTSDTAFLNVRYPSIYVVENVTWQNRMSCVVGNGIWQIILYHRNVAMTGMIYLSCTAPQLQPVS